MQHGERSTTTWWRPRDGAPYALVAALLLAAVVLVPSTSCSFAVDANRFEDGNCPSTTKACNDECVALDAASVGCALHGCSPCDLTNANATCSSTGACQVDTCTASNYKDCDHTDSTGCEVDINYDPNNCGECGCRCGTMDRTDCPSTQNVETIINGSAGCNMGTCTVGRCDPGWGDCDNRVDTGCEEALDSGKNCGVCGNVCPAGCDCNCTQFDPEGGCGCLAVDGGACP
jgi:hypothetical protein